MAPRSAVSVLSIVSIAGSDLGTGFVTDPSCPIAGCCDVAAGVAHEGSASEPCDFSAPWTRAYCCSTLPSVDCYRWGEDAPGHDLVSYTALSAVQCRHLCQAHERCAVWSYLVDIPDLGPLRGRCFLKDQAAISSRARSHPFVISGERLCQHFQEGTSEPPPSLLAAAVGTPWCTFASTGTDRAAASLPFLPAAGTAAWALEAAGAFEVLGFVAVLDAIPVSLSKQLLATAEEVARQMLSLDPQRLGNRGPRRYSFGGASQYMHIMHVQPWAELLDLSAVHILLQAIWPEGYLAAGGGGDFVLASTDTYQSLHIDLGSSAFHELDAAPAIAVNVLLEDLDCRGGPVRVVPGSHRWPGAPPTLDRELQDFKVATLCPLPAGTVILRDLRAWHGGTPNVLARTRHLPNAEFVNAQWGPRTCRRGGYLDPCAPVLPESAHKRLSEQAKAISHGIVAERGEGAWQEEPASSCSWLLPDFAKFTRHSEDAF